ncbi:ATP-binding protein [Aliarcobacter butzleri]|nr:AAA family ATPase [Aliarcobacter butzleri]MCG3665173.1 ATP-binding protein [Aliarcobacter butzleri]
MSKNKIKKMHITNINIIGLFKYLNYDIPFNEGINIIHGINGKGKTTILNIITNILNGDLKKFYQLSFKKIEITFNNGFIKIYRNDNNKLVFDFKIDTEIFEERDVSNTNSIKAFLNRITLKPLLLPAQRVSIQETYHIERDIDILDYRYRRMSYERDRFYREEKNIFQPNPKMIDILSIPRELIERARKFSMVTTRSFSNLDMKLFEKFFETTLFSNIENNNDFNVVEKIKEIKIQKNEYFSKYKKLFIQSKILEKIEELISNEDINFKNNQINDFLSLYLDNIKQKNRVISKYVTPFTNLEKIINSLFDGKKIQISTNEELNNIFKIISKSDDEISIQHFSSGEKNLILIFFHFLFEVDEKTLFMIDEPELSLHIDWQYSIIKYFQEYSNNNQILVVTHSPDIMQDHREYQINLDKCII